MSTPVTTKTEILELVGRTPKEIGGYFNPGGNIIPGGAGGQDGMMIAIHGDGLAGVFDLGTLPTTSQELATGPLVRFWYNFDAFISCRLQMHLDTATDQANMELAAMWLNPASGKWTYLGVDGVGVYGPVISLNTAGEIRGADVIVSPDVIGSGDVLIGIFSGTAPIVGPHYVPTLSGGGTGAGGGGNSSFTSPLTVTGSVTVVLGTAGSSTIQLGSTTMTGTIPSGFQYTILGVLYTTTASATAASNLITLTNSTTVPITIPPGTIIYTPASTTMPFGLTVNPNYLSRFSNYYKNWAEIANGGLATSEICGSHTFSGTTADLSCIKTEMVKCKGQGTKYGWYLFGAGGMPSGLTTLALQKSALTTMINNSVGALHTNKAAWGIDEVWWLNVLNESMQAWGSGHTGSGIGGGYLHGGDQAAIPWDNGAWPMTDYTAANHYMAYMLTACRAASPTTLLALNFNHQETDSTQRANILTLAQGLKAAGIPLDIIGLESHLVASNFGTTFQASGLTTWAAALAAIGVSVMITELDVTDDTQLGVTPVAPTYPLRDARAASVVTQFMATVMTFPNLVAFQCWELSDQTSWLNPCNGFHRSEFTRWTAASPACWSSGYPPFEQPQRACPLDLNWNIKPGYYGAIKGAFAQLPASP